MTFAYDWVTFACDWVTFACDWVTFACRDVEETQIEIVNASDQTSHHSVSGPPGLSLGARSLCLCTHSLCLN